MAGHLLTTQPQNIRQVPRIEFSAIEIFIFLLEISFNLLYSRPFFGLCDDYSLSLLRYYVSAFRFSDSFSKELEGDKNIFRRKCSLKKSNVYTQIKILNFFSSTLEEH